MHVVRVRPQAHPAELKIAFLAEHVHAAPSLVDCDPTVRTSLALDDVSKVTQVAVQRVWRI